MSEMALREQSPDKIREEIFDIRDAGHNLMGLVSDILDFAQLQQGKMNILRTNSREMARPKPTPPL